MGILWILAGIVLVTGAFFIPGGGDVWASLDAAGIAAALYLITLVLFTTRKPFPRAARLALCCAFLITGAGVVLCWTGMSRNTDLQKEWLLKVHGSISRNVMIDEMPSMLQKVLKSYYLQSPDHKESIGKIFQKSYPSALMGRNIHISFDPEDSLTVSLVSLSDQEVVLVGQHMYVKGNNAGFKNFDGRLGMVQGRAILTEEGVRYESEN